MNPAVQFVEQVMVTKGRKPFDIIFRGQKYGTIEPSDLGGSYAWHAEFKVVPGKCGGPLMPGFGRTPEKAFRSAFDRARSDLALGLYQVESARRTMLCEDERGISAFTDKPSTARLRTLGMNWKGIWRRIRKAVIGDGE